jgi:LPXTG-site transpeptidase (sortase) family protein
MKSKKSILEKLFSLFITVVVTLSLFFIWPPNTVKDQEEHFAYLDKEFNGLTEIFSFHPRLFPAKKKKPKKTKIISLEKEADLIIPKINIQAPIIFNVDAGNSAEYLSALERGVAHFAGTALPGDSYGNIFIFGHSSYYRNKPGDFKEIFKDLEKLEIGNKIIIKDKTEDKEYKYKVLEKKIVESNFTEAFNQEGKYKLTLMTCWPVGTNRKRLLITAELVREN